MIVLYIIANNKSLSQPASFFSTNFEIIKEKHLLLLLKASLKPRAIRIFLNIAHKIETHRRRLNFSRLLKLSERELKIPESTLKWNLKKFKDIGLIEYDYGEPIDLTSLGRLLYAILKKEIEYKNNYI